MCDHCELRELRLVRDNGAVIAMGRLAMKAGNRWARSAFGEDGRFWDADFQMIFEPHPGGWFLVHNPSAANETLVNGAPLADRIDLQAGMMISVGRAALGIQKTPFTVQFD